MSHAILFDTLAYANRLKNAGVPDKQAEAQSEALAHVFDEQVAAKKDLLELETRIENNFEKALHETEARLIARMDSKFAAIDDRFATIDERFAAIDNKFTGIDSKLAGLKAELIQWMVSLVFIQSTLLIGAFKVFH